MALSQPTTVEMSYARALLELATPQNQAQPVGEEMAGIRGILDSDPGFAQFLADPSMGRTARTAAVERIFRNRTSPLVMNFIGVLDENGRLAHLAEIAAAYGDLLDEQLGNVEVELTVAQALSDADLERVRGQIGSALNKHAVVHQHVDDSIIGGMVLRVQDRLIDASVRYQLQAIKEKLFAAAPK
jgi:F-type H+-transporting ATPase subunit delta